MWATSKNHSGDEKSLRFPKPQVAGPIPAEGASEILVNTGISAYLQAFIALFCICRIYGVSRLVPRFHGTGAGWSCSKAVALQTLPLDSRCRKLAAVDQ